MLRLVDRRLGRSLRTVGFDHDQPCTLKERSGIDLGFLDPRWRRRRKRLLDGRLLLARQRLAALILAQLILLYMEGWRGARWPGVALSRTLLAALAMPVAPAAASAAALLLFTLTAFTLGRSLLLLLRRTWLLFLLLVRPATVGAFAALLLAVALLVTVAPLL